MSPLISLIEILMTFLFTEMLTEMTVEVSIVFVSSLKEVEATHEAIKVEATKFEARKIFKGRVGMMLMISLFGMMLMMSLVGVARLWFFAPCVVLFSFLSIRQYIIC